MVEWMDGWMGGWWMDGWVDGWIDGLVNEWITDINGVLVRSLFCNVGLYWAGDNLG